MDEIELAIEEVKKQEMRNLLVKSAICVVCSLTDELYLCAGNHRTVICKKCLSSDQTNNVIDYCTGRFRPLINQEEDTICSFIPLIQKEKTW